MNIEKLFNASQALDKLGILQEVTLGKKYAPNRSRSTYHRTIDGGATEQQIKLAIALSDTSYPVIHTAIELKNSYFASEGDLAVYYKILMQDRPQAANPIETALKTLGV